MALAAQASTELATEASGTRRRDQFAFYMHEQGAGLVMAARGTSLKRTALISSRSDVLPQIRIDPKQCRQRQHDRIGRRCVPTARRLGSLLPRRITPKATP
jgi:hypothetical protein